MNVPARRPPRDFSQDASHGLGGIKHPMISRNGNRFTLIDTNGTQRPWQQLSIDVVIANVSQHVNRVFYEGDYEPGAGEPPACFSDNGVGPSKESRAPQNATCTACPQSAWGSKVTQQGKEVPACQSGKKLAVQVLGDDTGLVYEFRVPPGSFNHKPGQDPWEGGWLWYVGALKGASLQLSDVVTRISFKPGTMGVLTFKPVQQLSAVPALQENLYKLWDAAWPALEAIVGTNDQPIDPTTWRPGTRAVSDQTQRPNIPPPAQQQTQLPLPTQPPLQGGVAAVPPFAQQGQPAAAAAAPPPGFGAPVQTAEMKSPFEQPRQRRPRRTKEQMAADAAARGGAGHPMAEQPPAQQTPREGEVLSPLPGGAGPTGSGAPPFTSGQPAGQPAGQPGDVDIPPFLLRQNGTPPAAQPQPSFGMEQPQAPDAQMQANLEAAFKLPT